MLEMRHSKKISKITGTATDMINLDGIEIPFRP
jgi:hypothetical protein